MLGSEDWFSRRTLHHGSFEDMDDLLRRKRERGSRISVCLPTQNEAETIGEILRLLREELVEGVPLVDELAIIDSGSNDGTVELARAQGALVFDQRRVLPEHANAGGKGEALWKSLHVLSGDIIVWLDSDIRNMHPRFVYGLVGPILHDADVGYVKAFYRRPLHVDGRVLPDSGGRVTELVARPLFSLFYPDLNAFIQPLSGEYAGRRDVLEAIPFLTGYGVEIGMLIDIYEQFGLDVMAQVDLEERIHRNQNLQALGRMSFEIMQGLLMRLQNDGKIDLLEQYGDVWRGMVRDDAGYHLRQTPVRIAEKPPMNEVRAALSSGGG